MINKKEMNHKQEENFQIYSNLEFNRIKLMRNNNLGVF